MNFVNTAPKGWTQRFVDWTFGLKNPSSLQTPNPSKTLGDANGDPQLVSDVEDSVPVWVDQSARSPLEAFKDSISDATRLFCEQYVYPLYGLDKRTKYRITGIQMFVPPSKSSFLQVLEKLPIDVRNRMTRILVMAAPGAKDQLVIDDGFFGLSLDVEPAVVEGNTIRLIAAWSRDSAEVKFVFSGQYISVNDVQPQEMPAVDQAAKQSSAQPSQNSTHPDETSIGSNNGQDLQLSNAQPSVLGESRASTSTIVEANALTALARKSIDTPLGVTLSKPAARGKETPMGGLQTRHIANLRVQYYGHDQETCIAITAEMLPFTIGRDHSSTGRFKNGLSLADSSDSSKALLVSREHLEINRYEPISGNFYFINHGHSRNGSYHFASALSERFMLKALPGGTVIHLGGDGGVGTVRVTIEAI